MFTDGPVTPLRLEALIEVLHGSAPKALTRDAIDAFLQPSGLPGLTGSSDQARETLAAARELELVQEEARSVRIRKSARKKPFRVRELILDALDEKVLSSVEVEPYFASFFSFLLGLDGEGAMKRSGQEWANEFNRVVHLGRRVANPFNETKYAGLRRWYRYAGLGWTDQESIFHCNPYFRLRRKLPTIFADARVLPADIFMKRLASACPELDAGSIFLNANPNYEVNRRTCTLGLSQALLELHVDGVVRLECPVDVLGWSLALAEPPRDGVTIRSDHLTSIEYLG